MPQQPIRAAAVAGSWYPGTAEGLRRAVRGYLDSAGLGALTAEPQRAKAVEAPSGAEAAAKAIDVRAVIAPHAGLMYSGPVGAFAYAALAGRRYDAVAIVGPSHYVAFDGVAICARGSFATPLGPLPIAEPFADALQRASRHVRDVPGAHAREHSLEMQLPFLAYLLPGTPIVPMVMGDQGRETVADLAHAMATAFAGREVLLVASSDLSHYHDAATAARMDGRIVDLVARFDPEGLLEALEELPEHACGGGPIVAVMLAARDLGARDARVLRYADSGDVSGDKNAVVGYMAAALGTFS